MRKLFPHLIGIALGLSTITILERYVVPPSSITTPTPVHVAEEKMLYLDSLFGRERTCDIAREIASGHQNVAYVIAAEKFREKYCSFSPAE